jgi:hypothetical protein
MQVSRGELFTEFLKQIKAHISDFISFLPTLKDTPNAQPCYLEFHFYVHVKNEVVVVACPLLFNSASLFVIMKILDYQIGLKLNKTHQLHD